MQRKIGIRILFVVCIIFCGSVAFGQPTEKFVKVVVAPDHDDWTYRSGERVKFSITVLHNGNPVQNAKKVGS